MVKKTNLFYDSEGNIVWKYVSGVVALFIIIISIIGMILTSSIRGECDYRYSRFLHEHFEGKIIKTFKDENNHNYEKIQLEDKTILNIDPMSPVKLFEHLKVNDYIIKRKNELKCTVISNGDLEW